jgi:ABC-type glycerol-3-phosphate transport system permease component
MKEEKSNGWLTIMLCIGAVIVIFPFLWTVLSAFKTPYEIIKIPPSFFPARLYWGGFQKVLFEAPFLLWMVNSLLVAVTTTVITMFTSALAGYIYAKFDFPGKRLSFLAILATLMVPFEVILISTYMVADKLGLLNSLAGLIVPAMVSAFGIFLCKQFIEAIPSDLVESGRVDGASELRIFFQIIVPEIRPVLSALAIFTFMGSWNNYLWPLVAINDTEKMTVPLALYYFNTAHVAQYNVVMAAATLIMIPVIIVYLIFQRQFIEGLAMTGIK